MNIRTATNDTLLIELDDRCAMPIRVQRILDSELEFPEPKYFRWHLKKRGNDPEDLDVEFGEGTLSPPQNIALLLYRASKATGDYVKLLPSYHFCPALIGDDDKMVGLYHFVEVLDGIIDYDKIKEELPNLSYAQINGSMMFLRKVAQFNIKDIDIDELEDEQFEDDPVFLDELKRAFADQETTRVLSVDKRDNE
jgi:hypothetical protein